MRYELKFDLSGRRLVRCVPNENNGNIIVDFGRLVVPNGVEEIGPEAFSNCRDLRSIILPDSLKKIDVCAFCCCTRLASITIPANVNEIGPNPFVWCVGLYTIKVDPNNKVFDSRDNCNAIIETKTNILKFGCAGSIIPKSVCKLESCAFFKCMRLNSFTIPENVTVIGESAFYECENLRSVEMKEGVREIEKYAFQGCHRLRSVKLPRTMQKIKDQAFLQCGNLNDVNFSEGLYLLGRAAFSGCNLSSVTIPSTLTSIGIGALDAVESIVVDKNNPRYDSRDGCNAVIETATDTLIIGCNNTFIPDGIKTIGPSAFSGCKELKLKSIPDTCVEIKNYAFSGSEVSLDKLPAQLEYIDDSAFYGCQLSGLELPAALKYIGKNAFCNAGLSSIILPQSLIYLGDSAFSFNDISEIHIPKNVQYVGPLRLRNCNIITVDPENSKYDSRNNCNAIVESETDTLIAGCGSTTIDSSVKTIGDSAFRCCDNLYSIVIPDGVSRVKSNAFRSMSLQTIVISADVRCMMFDSFPWQLKTVVVRWRDSDAIPYCPFYDNQLKSTTLYVPVGTKEIYKNSSWKKFNNIIEMK